MSTLPGTARDSWTRLGTGTVLGVGLLWGLALATLELAYFIPANQSWPLGPGHALLWLILAAQFCMVAWGAALAGRILGRRGAAGAAGSVLAAPLALLFILAVSLYRDHTMVHTRLVMNIVTLAGAAVWGIALFLGVRAVLAHPAAVTLRVLRGVALVALALGLGALVANRVAPAKTAVEWVTPEQVGQIPDTGLRVLLVGVDGGSWSVLDPLLAAGRMPALAGLAARGVTARLETVVPTYSPNLWTSVVTGKTLEKHGVSSHVFTRMPFGLPPAVHMPRHIRHLTKMVKLDVRLADRAGLLPPGIYSSENVSARRLWELAEGFGMRSIGLEWYVTHPVQPVDGIQISDRFHLLEGEALRTAVHPDSLAPVLEPRIVKPAAIMDRLVSLADVQDLDDAGREKLVSGLAETFRAMAVDMARDQTTLGLLPDVFPRVPDWKLAAVYYRGMDASHHMTWQYREQSGEAAPGSPGQRLRPVVDNYNALCDELVARTLEQADSSTVVIALSDHGWESAQWGHSRKPDGFFVMAGGPVLRSTERAAISVYDVAPTVLALLGIPVPEDVDGRVASELVDPEFWARFPVRTVPSYEGPRQARAADAAPGADEEVLEQLRALGYVGE